MVDVCLPAKLLCLSQTCRVQVCSMTTLKGSSLDDDVNRCRLAHRRCGVGVRLTRRIGNLFAANEAVRWCMLTSEPSCGSTSAYTWNVNFTVTAEMSPVAGASNRKADDAWHVAKRAIGCERQLL